MIVDFSSKTKDLIDGLKGTCANYGLGNDGNEFKIITQVFLYKFMNDKFGYELKKMDSRFANSISWEKDIELLSDEEFNQISRKLSPGTAKLKKTHFISHLFNKQNTANFAQLFDSTLLDISQSNSSVFSVSTSNNSKIVLFDELSQYISDVSRRDEFCKALINQVANFSFEEIFEQKFDFFSTIFEYLIKDYNKDGGGKYAEYYTPHAVSKIMAKILVNREVKNVRVYDPSAGSGTLLMNVAHEIGEKNCSIYSQDISQKSSGMLRLNLILNDLVHSIPNIIQGDTLLNPFFIKNGKVEQFDFVVSNPPFKLDFSDFRSALDTKENKERFFAGIPEIPKKKPDQMAIYLLFIQHIMASMSPKGKAAVVVPTGFLGGKDKISVLLRKHMIDSGILAGVISMPSNIFATTGTSVSVLFLDNSTKSHETMLVDASNLGVTVKEGKNKKTLLSSDEEDLIIDTFSNQVQIADFSVKVTSVSIEENGYSLNPGLYFEIPSQHVPLSDEEYKDFIGQTVKRVAEIESLENKLNQLLKNSVQNILDLKKPDNDTISIDSISANKYELLDSTLQTIFAKWFIDFDFPNDNGLSYKTHSGPMKRCEILDIDIPANWKTVKLSNNLKIGSGFPFDSETYTPDGRYGVVTIKNVQDFKLDTKNLNRVDEIPRLLQDFCILNIGDVLISLTGNVGRVARVNRENLLLNQRVGKFICEPYFKYFAYLFITRPEQRQRLEKTAFGSAQANLSPVDATDIYFVCPDELTLKKFDEIVSPMFDVLYSI
jgi:type I restriction enzyme M protein